MSLGEQLQKQQYQEIWNQYCGFLDLNMEEYMNIQKRLMEDRSPSGATVWLEKRS